MSALLNLLHGGSTPGSLIARCLRLTRTLETGDHPPGFSLHRYKLKIIALGNIGNYYTARPRPPSVYLDCTTTSCRSIIGRVIGEKQVSRCRLIFLGNPVLLLVWPINRVERPHNGPGIEFTPCYRLEPIESAGYTVTL